MKRSWIVVAIAALVVCGLGVLVCILAFGVFGAGVFSTARQAIVRQTIVVDATVEAPQSAETQAPQVDETMAPEPAATSVGSPTQAAGESLTLNSRGAGLDKLKSYRLRWQSQWTSTEGGKTSKANWDWVEEFSSNPQALHWTWKFTDVKTATPNGMEAWQIGDTTYMVTGNQGGQANCISFSTADASQRLGKGLFSPDALGGVTNGRYVGNETVNGIPSKHFQYDQKSGTVGGFGKVSGDVWVAVDGGYVVKDNMHWEGGAGLFGATGGNNGQGQWVWDLSDANQPITITPPPNCEGAAGGLPMMPDATEKNSFGDTIIYKTASKVADVVAFYKNAMTAAGWKLEGAPTTGDSFATLTFSQGTKKAQVSITTEGGQTNVIINVTK